MPRERRTGGCWRRGGSPWKLFSLNSRIRGTERVGGDGGNEKAKKERSFFPFCCHKTTVGTLGETDINYGLFQCEYM